ncbi:hypothetical protein HNE05_07645 [Aquipseudomonas campi]|uniref:Uncharacterized protein n=1 Tax=Aquipseudomonas campi TaxID=2731681 RepID=A0A6M8FT92_9GAMM|nr:hypothetical protein [Pseudomonas campi]QKE63236.1 hypothetical protein HNE05_07645 [Pseudomonas campi]
MASVKWELPEIEHVLDKYKEYGKENIAGFLKAYKSAWPELKQPARATFVGWLEKSGTSNAPSDGQQSITDVLREAKKKLGVRKAQLETQAKQLKEQLQEVEKEIADVDAAIAKL